MKTYILPRIFWAIMGIVILISSNNPGDLLIPLANKARTGALEALAYGSFPTLKSPIIGDHKSFLPVVKNGTAYFVSPSGNDAGPGSQTQPWRTIGKAASMVVAGDAIYIHGGVYIEKVDFSRSGTEIKPIRILAYQGETPIIDGNNQLPNSYTGLLSISGDWVQVSGLEVRNSNYMGVALLGKHDMADNIYAHHSQKSGIYISGDYGIVENSRIWQNSLQNEGGKNTTWASGLIAGRDTTDGLTEYAIMRKNVVWENWGQGINTYEANQTIIEDNISYDNFSTNIYISDATNVLCQRNLVYMTPESVVYGTGPNVGIMMGDEKFTPPSANIKVINNIAYGNSRNFSWWKGTQNGGMNNVLIANNTFVNSYGDFGVVISEGSHQNARFENNIVQQDKGQGIIYVPLNPELTLSNNLWSEPPISAAFGPGDVVGDPKLAKIGQPNAPEWFILTNSSPAINKAKSLLEVVDDYFGNSRGSYPDIGAIEYVTSGNNISPLCRTPGIWPGLFPFLCRRENRPRQSCQRNRPL